MKQVKRQGLRQGILEGMVFWAEGGGSECGYLTKKNCAKMFSPGVSDRYLFNEILDGVIDKIAEEIDSGEDCTGRNLTIIGMNVMNTYYDNLYERPRE